MLFDKYVSQDFLDSSLRGGLPLILGEGDSDNNSWKVYHTYSRIHGDIERDYNNYDIDTTFYSQGSGNFRDVLQNRRMDVMLEPRVNDFNIHMVRAISIVYPLLSCSGSPVVSCSPNPNHLRRYSFCLSFKQMAITPSLLPLPTSLYMRTKWKPW